MFSRKMMHAWGLEKTASGRKIGTRVRSAVFPDLKSALGLPKLINLGWIDLDVELSSDVDNSARDWWKSLSVTRCAYKARVT